MTDPEAPIREDRQPRASVVKATACVTAAFLTEAVTLHRAGQMDEATLMILNRVAVRGLKDAVQQPRDRAEAALGASLREDGKV